MNVLALLVSFVPALVQLIPQMLSIWSSSPGNALIKLAAVAQNSSVATTAADIGAANFPLLAPEFHAAAAFLIHGHPDNTAYVQDTLNFIESTGYINFGPALKVDGSWGPKTKAAVGALQTKLGVPSSGFLLDAEYSALSVLRSKFSGTNIAVALAAVIPQQPPPVTSSGT